MASISEYDLGWLVGILEGEGYFGLLRCPQGKSQKIAVKMCDEDIVLRVANLFEQITGNSFDVRMKIDKKHPNWSPQYEVYIGGENARIVMKLVVKRMGIRRRKKIYQTLNGHAPIKVNLDLSILDEIIPPKETAVIVPLKRRAV